MGPQKMLSALDIAKNSINEELEKLKQYYIGRDVPMPHGEHVGKRATITDVGVYDFKFIVELHVRGIRVEYLDGEYRKNKAWYDLDEDLKKDVEIEKNK